MGAILCAAVDSVPTAAERKLRMTIFWASRCEIKQGRAHSEKLGYGTPEEVEVVRLTKNPSSPVE